MITKRLNFAPANKQKDSKKKDKMTKSKHLGQEQTLEKGLYQSSYEHDACGVGMIVNIHGNKSHELVDHALKVLENMRHRGAEVGNDGDGAGIMLQIPHEFILLQGQIRYRAGVLAQGEEGAAGDPECDD